MQEWKYSLENLGSYLKGLIMPSVFILLSIVLLLLVREISMRLLSIWSRKTGSKLTELLIRSARTPSLIWCIILGIYVGISTFDIPEKYLIYVNKLTIIIIILSITFFISNLLNSFIRYHIDKSNLSIPTTSFIYTILSVIIFITGLLLILTSLNVSITPIITTLGIGGLAIAIALKDTLTNIFAGLHILMEKSIRVGDFIRLENGQEGYLEDLTWRTSRIKTISNNTIIIPNSKLSQSIIMNYSLPEPKMSIQVPISVSYSTNIEKVEKILLEIANNATGDIKGLLAEPKPIVRLTPGFSLSSIDLTIICFIEEYRLQNLIQHELKKRILERFKEEGIEFPLIKETDYYKNKGA